MQKKCSVSLEENLIERMDKFAADKGLNRSGLIAVACTQYMDASEAMPGMNAMLAAFAAFMQTVAEGKIEPGTPEYDAAIDKVKDKEVAFKKQLRKKS